MRYTLRAGVESTLSSAGEWMIGTLCGAGAGVVPIVLQSIAILLEFCNTYCYILRFCNKYCKI